MTRIASQFKSFGNEDFAFLILANTTQMLESNEMTCAIKICFFKYLVFKIRTVRFFSKISKAGFSGLNAVISVACSNYLIDKTTHQPIVAA